MREKIMRRIILITGGARSGKSKMALELANIYEEKIFIATATARDTEMKERIEKHKQERGKDWKVIEDPIKIKDKILSLSTSDNVIVVDCLTFFLFNLMENRTKDQVIEEIESLKRILEDVKGCIIFVTNEVGSGIIPDNQLAREFRDLQGIMNKKIAEVADEVYLMCCGIPLKIK